MHRRIVVTGMGLVTPLGYQVLPVWERILKGDSGISAIRGFDVTNYPSRIAGQFEEKDYPSFSPDHYMSSKERARFDRFIFLGTIAAQEALADARWAPSDPAQQERTAVLLGSGIGGLPEIERTAVSLHQKGMRRGVSPFFIPASLINLLAGHVAIRFGFKGPNLSLATACATGSHTIGEAARLIQCGDADVVIAGGAESAVCPIGVGGFCALWALSDGYNDTPQKASRPWDRGRDGFVISEGAGVLVLEDRDHALNRQATIHGEIIGYGATGDAHHITAPSQDGDGAYRCMKMALKKANLDPQAIGYINAHGTSTPAGDLAELRAVERLFQNTDVSMSSTKSSIGHALGAAGSIEAIFSLMALKTQKIPGTLNLENSEETFLDLVPMHSRSKSLQYAMSNSFGFGGTNVTLIFSKH